MEFSSAGDALSHDCSLAAGITSLLKTSAARTLFQVSLPGAAGILVVGESIEVISGDP